MSKISVVVPVYGVEPYLRRCLDSIVGQTYENLEILLVDDGSPDNCGAICDEYAAKDPRIVVIHQKNAGVSAARNAALETATGDWIGFADGDDWLEPDMYAYLIGLTEQYDADVVQCGFFFDESDQSEVRFAPARAYMARRSGAGLSWKDWHQLSYANWNKIYRTSVLRDLRFDPSYSFGEDLLFNVRVLQRTNRVCFGTYVGYHYIQRQDSACHKLPSMEYLSRNRLALEHAAELVRDDRIAARYFCEVLTLEALDTCSKIVRFYDPAYEPVKDQLRTYIRKNLGRILTIASMRGKEKLKCILLCLSWTVYSRMLRAGKKKT